MPLQTTEQLRTAITEGAERYNPQLASAPPILGPPHHLTPVAEVRLRHTLDTRSHEMQRPGIKSQQPTLDTFHSPNDPSFTLDRNAPLRAVRHPQEDDGELGSPFQVEWLCTERLPFYMTRHLRNEWNKDREVKVSRDGTEVEPTVGERLLSEWRTLAADAVGKSQGKKRPKTGPDTR